MSYILIIGAKSDIAKAVARKYAKEGYNLYLAARKSSELEEFSNDINIRTQKDVKCVELDILDYASHEAFYDALEVKPLGVISAVGYLGEQDKAQRDFKEAKKIIDTNYTGIVSLLNIIANDFEKRESGFIVGISSAAGDRGRKSNYIYGSAKAAFTAYLSGLRNRLYDSQVHVMTVKPGFVATKMTEGMDLPKKLTAQPEGVAEDIYQAQRKEKNVLYTKWIWIWIMLIIKNIPEFVFKRISI
jgi:short-subunit dehydrogenase